MSASSRLLRWAQPVCWLLNTVTRKPRSRKRGETKAHYLAHNDHLRSLKYAAECCLHDRERDLKRSRAHGEHLDEFDDSQVPSLNIKRKRTASSPIVVPDYNALGSQPPTFKICLGLRSAYPDIQSSPQEIVECPEVDIDMVDADILAIPATSQLVQDGLHDLETSSLESRRHAPHAQESADNGPQRMEEDPTTNLSVTSPAEVVAHYNREALILDSPDAYPVVDYGQLFPSPIDTFEPVFTFPEDPRTEDQSPQLHNDPDMSDATLYRPLRTVPLPADPLLSESAFEKASKSHRHEKLTRTRHNPYARSQTSRTKDPRVRPSPAHDPRQSASSATDESNSSSASRRRRRRRPEPSVMFASVLPPSQEELAIACAAPSQADWYLEDKRRPPIDDFLREDVVVVRGTEPDEVAANSESPEDGDEESEDTSNPELEKPVRTITEKDIFGDASDLEDGEASTGPATPTSNSVSEEIVDAFLETCIVGLGYIGDENCSPVVTQEDRDQATMDNMIARFAAVVIPSKSSEEAPDAASSGSTDDDSPAVSKGKKDAPARTKDLAQMIQGLKI